MAWAFEISKATPMTHLLQQPSLFFLIEKIIFIKYTLITVFSSPYSSQILLTSLPRQLYVFSETLISETPPPKKKNWCEP